MISALIDALFCAAGLLAWGQATERLAMSAALALGLLAAAVLPFKLASNDKAKGRVNDLTLVATACAAVWFWLQRQSLQTNFALHILSLCPLLLYPKLLFNLLQAGGVESGASPTRDGANIARRWLSIHFPFSRNSLDARRPMRFDSAYFMSSVFIACFNLPWRAALPLLAMGLIPHALWRGWRPAGPGALKSAAGALAASAMAIALAIGGGRAIEKGQDLAEDYFSQLWNHRGGDAMPSGDSTDTAIGRRGRVDNGNKLLARLDWSQPSGYLRNGVYSYTSNGITWFSHAPSQSSGDQAIFPVDGTTFTLPSPSRGAKAKPSPERLAQAKISMTFGRERMAIPVPIGTTEIFGLPFNKLEVNGMGVPVAGGNPGFAKFGVSFHPDGDDLPAPESADLDVPLALAGAVDRFVDESKARGLTPAQSAKAIAEHFRQGWKYTLNLESQDGTPRSLTRFLARDREGHCEYFAAATTLAMRRLGIPARYQTGFLVNEYDQREKLFWIRSRDAHAWSSYWDGRRWTLLDTTPGGPPDAADWASAGSDWMARLQYVIEDFDAAALAGAVDTRLLWALGALVLAYAGMRMRLRRVAPGSASEAKETEKLGARLEALTGLTRAPRETSYDFWLRCAPRLAEASALRELARRREEALFMPGPDAPAALARCDAQAKKVRLALRLAKAA